MSALLAVRKAVKDTLTPLGVPVLYADAVKPTAGEYFILTVISAPGVDDWAGLAYRTPRIQVDLWTLSASDTRAGTLGEQALQLFNGPPWRIRVSAQPLTHEGQRDAANKLWYRHSFDVLTEA